MRGYYAVNEFLKDSVVKNTITVEPNDILKVTKTFNFRVGNKIGCGWFRVFNDGHEEPIAPNEFQRSMDITEARRCPKKKEVKNDNRI